MATPTRTSSGTHARFAGVAALLAVVLGALVAGSATAAPQATVTLRMSNQTNGVDLVFPALIANFHRAYPNIEVKLEQYPIATYQQTLLSQFQAGTAPDIIFGNGGTGQLYGFIELARAGRLANLAPATWTKRIPASAKPLWTIGNRVYGLPLGAAPIGPIYDKDAFARLKLKVPTTFQQFLNICKVARDNGVAAISIAGAAFFNNGIWMNMIAGSTVYSKNPNWNALRSANKTTFAKDWVLAVTRFKLMKDRGCFLDGAQGLANPAEIWRNVATGRALMGGGPSGVIASVVNARPSANVGQFPFPGTTAADTRAVIGLADGFAVNAASKQKAAAKLFLTFIAREGQSRIWTKNQRAIALTDVKNGKVAPETAAFGPYFKAGKTVPLPNLTFKNGSAYLALGQQLQGILTGQKTVAEVLAAVDTAWNNG